ncbi:MAG: hypothetical protein KF746_24545 [Chitinophagaceae bacterium]|nr:hypothetical protein [Chitinophagaceae bacterium]
MVTVVIPIYKSTISHTEDISLRQCAKVLGKYTITIIKPAHLEIDGLLSYFCDVHVENFPQHYFEGIEGYNKLMLSPEFYERFLKYEFILIYQLDAFVFSDQLLYWCRQKYDYIGAPWLFKENVKISWKEKIKRFIARRTAYRNNTQQPGSNLPVEQQFHNKVGNGGFSLRRVKKFYCLSKKMKEEIKYYNGQHHHLYNEDVFWSLEVNRKKKQLRIPHYKKALQFSVELYPEYAFHINHHRLPFGCHAWNLFPGFWKPFMKEAGYII